MEGLFKLATDLARNDADRLVPQTPEAILEESINRLFIVEKEISAIKHQLMRLVCNE